ncbi:MAG TPA: ChbG/HpnK family deacetylase [Geothermobacteraceae bacterium]|nr:ChbG/HpnK family deacetylase [Geothermobacteraceae bacterium]
MQDQQKTAMIRRMAKLIINADDLGAGNETDRAIFETFDSGVVTSASLLVNGPSARSAAATVRQRNLPVGVHLNLSEGSPLTGPIEGLTEANGRFAGKRKTRQKLQSHTYDRDALQREIKAQVQAALDWGLTPDHLDSHQHVFLYPDVTRATIEAARVFDIKAVRLPRPYNILKNTPPSDIQGDLRLYQQLSGDAETLIKGAGLACPQGLLGLDCLNRLSVELLVTLLTAVPEHGDWELMVHPGHLDPDNPFSGLEREAECKALTAEKISALIRALNIELITFGDLPCAS